MNDYLQKILKGQAINYEAFLKKLPEAFRRRHRDLFSTEKVAANRWRVTVLNTSMFDELQRHVATPVSRVDAARKGNSHRHGTEVSFLLVYHGGLASDRPDSVVIAGDLVDLGFRPATSVLVVENERNFFHYRQMLAFVAECLNEPLELASCDVILGGGNRITQSSVLNWLAGYQRVFCAFDYDAGGLQMFATIAGKLGDRAQFVQPTDWQPWLAQFRMAPKTTERFTKAVAMAEDLGFIPLAQAFRATGKFMEQEMILND
ncbi:hypothetical protein [Marinobacter halophilus]|uniref:Wadjet protein JetD C-terminal domain-containing protein n=1 Tax=Marinobacter halophilus TaxID=1323740 RepID=A0A2T1KDL2_9GAMM|nr:hypothetical protein [Marinobacter halophilus]PSF07632.1 hypothetical protein C7H08_12100 [Marinobacter halophilus]GGC56146.1 hypothetical protein GCM10011362_00530 [Marinobacter halophilus]